MKIDWKKAARAFRAQRNGYAGQVCREHVLEARIAACEAVLTTKGNWSAWAQEALKALRGER